ncbi:siderophore-iron reductase FhuF [Variovorax sp. Varisp41]|uniref:siderophore-iron reductase FhuF n=1 Tax=unclassified Variovorax TaxID=663243 RepID=UPI0021BA41EA|nr:siderophore-iron reductase FhuF [Variovorax sp. CY25R-8]MCT8179005.1 siderophore-iron reductase FhuF [Variovorax sp. CY25R-8]
MLALLKPFFQGQFAPMGERLQCADAIPPGALRVDSLLHGDVLRALMQRQAAVRQVAGPDLRAVASAWVLDYLGALLPPVVAAATVVQHVFPMDAAEVWVRLDAGGGPIDFHLREIGMPLPGADTAQRYEALLWRHLHPLFEALCALTKVAPKILWGDVARVLEPILAQAHALTGGMARVAEDREHLLCATRWPRAPESLQGANPMHGRQRVLPRPAGDPRPPLRLHRQCCLYHLLPGEEHCGACPLAPRHREAGAAEA